MHLFVCPILQCLHQQKVEFLPSWAVLRVGDAVGEDLEGLGCQCQPVVRFVRNYSGLSKHYQEALLVL